MQRNIKKINAGILCSFGDDVNDDGFENDVDEIFDYNDGLLPSEDLSNMYYYFDADENVSNSSNNNITVPCTGEFRTIELETEDEEGENIGNVRIMHFNTDSLASSSSSLGYEQTSNDMPALHDANEETVAMPGDLRVLMAADFQNFDDNRIPYVELTNPDSAVGAQRLSRQDEEKDESSSVRVLIKRMFQSIEKV